MARPRSAAGTSLTRAPSMRISPPVAVSSPQIRRSSVDLPQPDGPTNTANSPSAISKSTPWITCVAPNALPTFASSSRAIGVLLLDAGGRHAGGDVLLQEREDDRDRDHGHHGHREQVVPLRDEVALERVQ